MRLGLAYNQRPDANPAESKLSDPKNPPSTVDAYVEWDDPTTIQAVAEALRVFGEVVLLEATDDFPTALALTHPDLLFNMAEGSSGPCREAHVPAIAEFLPTGGTPQLFQQVFTTGESQSSAPLCGRWRKWEKRGKRVKFAAATDLFRP